MSKILSDTAFDEVVQALPSIHLKASLTIHNVLMAHRIKELEQQIQELGVVTAKPNGRPLVTKTELKKEENATPAKTILLSEHQQKMSEQQQKMSEQQQLVSFKQQKIQELTSEIEQLKTQLTAAAKPAPAIDTSTIRDVNSLKRELSEREKANNENLKKIRSQSAQITNLRRQMEKAGLTPTCLVAPVFEETVIEKIVEVPVEKIVEQIVEKIVVQERVVEKIVEVPVEKLVERVVSNTDDKSVRLSERARIVKWLNKINNGETVRALYGQKMAKLIEAGDYETP